MKRKIAYSCVTDNVIPFIKETYDLNISALHGKERSIEEWRKLVFDGGSDYYTVSDGGDPVAWFRTEVENDVFWLGMLQVHPDHKRCGYGRYIVSVFEELARIKGILKVGIHTTEDNEAARSLYESSGYALAAIDECTTADGETRVGYTYFKDI